MRIAATVLIALYVIGFGFYGYRVMDRVDTFLQSKDNQLDRPEQEQMTKRAS